MPKVQSKSKKNPFTQSMMDYKNKKNNIDTSDNFESLFRQAGNEWTHGVGKNQTIKAEVINVDKKTEKIEVRTGLKSNSFIPFKEFRVNEEQILPTVGSLISVVMEGIDGNGRVYVSHKKVQFDAKLREIEQIHLNRQNGEHNKQTDPNLPQTIEGVVLYKQKVSSSSQYKHNSYVVDLGCGVLGLVVSDGFIELEPNKRIVAYVNRFEPKKYGIILGLKREAMENQHNENKNYENQENVKKGEILTLKVTEHKDFGLLCIKEEGEENKGNLYFVSSTELTLNKRIRKKNEIINLYPIGKILKAIVIGVKDSSGQEKLILSARALFTNLMTEFVNHIKVLSEGNKVVPLNGTIVEKRESEFIVKVEFEGNIVEGKLSREDLNWNLGKAINKYRTLYVGDVLEVAINWADLNMDNLDSEYHFLPFSVKILQPDPLQSVINMITLGQVYPCMFLANNEYGASMALKVGETWTKSDVDIVIQNRELKDLSKDLNTKPGATNYAKVTKIDPQNRCIYISIKSAEVDDIAKYSKSNQTNEEYTTLNNMIKKKR